MVYVFLGSGTTNSNGVAKLEKDAEGQSIDHSYTGTGAGEIDVVASLDKPIASGSVVSLPCNVIDAEILDTGIDGTSTNLFNDMTWFTRGTDGTTVYKENTTSGAIESRFPNKKDINDGVVIEMDVLECTFARFRIATYDSNNPATKYGAVTLNDTGKFRVEIRPTSIRYLLDGEDLIPQDTMTDSVQYYYVIRPLANETINFKYKNLAVYPI